MMILEGLVSRLMYDILKDVIVHTIIKKVDHVDEKEVEKIVLAYLAKHASSVPQTTITGDVIVVMNAAGLVGPNRRITLPLSVDLSDPTAVVDAIETKYIAGVKSRLGAPTLPEQDAVRSWRGTTGRVQRFEGGRDDPEKASVYRSVYGAFPTWGWIGRCYEQLGGTGGRLGFPISLEFDAAPSERGTVGQVQRFEGGPDDPHLVSIYCSGYGAFPTWGWVAGRHEELGGTSGRLGFPISREQEGVQSSRGTFGQIQHFEGGNDDPVGSSVYCTARGAYPVWGQIARAYDGLGGAGSSLGFPTSPELIAVSSPQGSSGWVQRFEGGDLYWTHRHGGIPVLSPILQVYEQHEGSGGKYGFPVGPMRTRIWGHSYRQEFEGGVISSF